MVLAPWYLLRLLLQDPAHALLQTCCEYLKRMCARLLVGAVKPVAVCFLPFVLTLLNWLNLSVAECCVVIVITVLDRYISPCN